jgi:hypothetical protein
MAWAGMMSLGAPRSPTLSVTPNGDGSHKRLIKNLEYLLPHLDMRRHLVPQKMFVGNRLLMAGARIRTARCDSDVIRRRPRSTRQAERMRSTTLSGR